MHNRNLTEQCLFYVAAQFTLARRFLTFTAAHSSASQSTCSNPYQKPLHWAGTLNVRYSITINWKITKYLHITYIYIYIARLDGPSGSRPPPCQNFEITLRRTTLGTTPPDEWSARRRDLCLTTHNTHNRQKSMAPAEFEPAVPTSERSQNTARQLRSASGIMLHAWKWGNTGTAG